MRKGAPEMHAFGQIEIRQNRRARRRKARNGFEKTVEIIRNTSVEKKRQRADRGNQNPGQAHHDKAFLGTKFASLLAEKQQYSARS